MHKRCINVLLTKEYEYLSCLYPKSMNVVFCLHRNRYNVCSLICFASYNPRNTFLLNLTVHRTNQLWQTLPSEVKGCPSTTTF